MLDAFEVSPLFFSDQHHTVQSHQHLSQAWPHVTVLKADVKIPTVNDADARDLPPFGQGEGQVANRP
jgi:hypothetical protein